MSDNPRRSISRRRMLSAGTALVGLSALPAIAAEASAASAPADALVVTLLGTGSPVPNPNRYGMSTLVQAGGLNLVFDAGRGCTIRLIQAGMPLGKVDAVFITHFHSDHLNGLPDLWMTSYLPPAFGRRKEPLEIYGPAGIADIVKTMRDAFMPDIRIRMDDEHVPEADTEIVPHEFSSEGIVFDQGGVTVSAFKVDHGAKIKPAYGYLVDYKGHSVLLSGDTKFDENLIAHGQGVDLMVHEVAAAPEAIVNEDYIQRILDHHTTPEEAGIVFTRTKPRQAVFSHIVELSDETHPQPSDDEIIRRARTTWSGNLLVGTDLTRFVVTSKDVTIQHYEAAHGFKPD